MNHYMPVRLFTGEHCIGKSSALFSGFGSRCAIITGKHSAVKSGALSDVTQALEHLGIEYRVFDGISQNPSVASCKEAGVFAKSFSADFIIGIGGGSALDAAKAAAVFAANDGLDEDGFYRKDWTSDPLPILLVGTTAGTGSEVTKVSVLTDSKGRKHSIHDDRLFAAAAFGDPRYTMALPGSVTLSTGIDVLSHCAESYFSRKADEVSRAFSIRGIRLLFSPLSAAAAGEELNISQRTELYEASILGGLAICDTGTCFPHNVGYYLTERFGVPHGFASAMFFPAMLELVCEREAAYAARFFRELDISREQLLQLVSACLPEQELSLTEAEILSALPRWENNNSVRNTCCAVGTKEIRQILEKQFSKEEGATYGQNQE